MKLAPDTQDALDRFALEQDITREEALAVIARDWLTGHGYQSAEEVEEEEAGRVRSVDNNPPQTATVRDTAPPSKPPFYPLPRIVYERAEIISEILIGFTIYDCAYSQRFQKMNSTGVSPFDMNWALILLALVTGIFTLIFSMEKVVIYYKSRLPLHLKLFPAFSTIFTLILSGWTVYYLNGGRGLFIYYLGVMIFLVKMLEDVAASRREKRWRASLETATSHDRK